MDYLLRLLMFEALYPGLSAETASPQLRHYRHRSLPAPHVSADVELLQPECGHGAESDGLRLMRTSEETAQVESRFTEHCWVEPLDPLSMAQVGGGGHRMVPGIKGDKWITSSSDKLILFIL